MNADDNELRRYVDGIVDNMNREELDACWNGCLLTFAAKIRAYVMQLQEETAREKLLQVAGNGENRM